MGTLHLSAPKSHQAPNNFDRATLNFLQITQCGNTLRKTKLFLKHRSIIPTADHLFSGQTKNPPKLFSLKYFWYFALVLCFYSPLFLTPAACFLSSRTCR